MTGSDYLLKGSIAGALLRFAIPVFLASILQVLYSAVDLLIVGNFASTADISAVAVSSQVMTTVILGISGLTTGLSVLVGQFAGAGNEKDVRRAAGSSVALFTLIAAALTAGLLAFSADIVSAMKTPPEAAEAARQYLAVCSAGIVFTVGYNVAGAIFRGLGDSRTPLVVVAAACAVNIALDLVFVMVIGMGACGAAIATVAAQALSLGLSAAFLARKGPVSRLCRRDLVPGREHIGKMLRLGLPLMLQEILVNLSFLLITAVVNRMGLFASAAVGTVEKIMGFLVMPTIALSAAVSAMTAQNVGAMQHERALKALKAGILISLAFAAAATAFCWADGEALPSLFTRDPEVVRQSALYLSTYVLDSVAVSFVFNINGYLSGCGRSVFSMAHSLFTTFAIRVPFVLIAGGRPDVSLSTIGMAAPVSSLGSILICLVYLSVLRRKTEGSQASPP